MRRIALNTPGEAVKRTHHYSETVSIWAKLLSGSKQMSMTQATGTDA